MAYNDLYIVDNSSEQYSVNHYLKEWCDVSKQMDIATGYLEIGGLLALDTHWQKLDKIRIILGNEMTQRTKDVIDKVVEALIVRFKGSVDAEQEHNDFLVGVPAILEAMQSGKIECRVFGKSKFHAKAYITYFNDDYRKQFIQSMNIPTGYALVGSSNFTKAGLTQNIELNVQLSKDVDQLQKWFDLHWEQGKDITTPVLSVIEKHVKEFSPYDIYLRSMYEYFKRKEKTISEWEQHESIIYKCLSQYQRDGYNSLVGIANRYSGAFLCDGVGLGKTYVGMMLIERFVKKERKNVVLITPAAARVSVWETTIKKYIPEILEGFYPFKIINHTDLLLEKKENLMKQIKEQSEVIVIDEAHHFRNRSSNRYRKLFDMMAADNHKQMFMLTATPINNSFIDLQHLIELFTHRQDDYFAAAPLGIRSLSGHFRMMEDNLKQKAGVDLDDAVELTEDMFRADPLVNELVVQRSRAYVKKSLSSTEGENVQFPIRKEPIVANYSLKSSYGELIDKFVASFDRKDKATGRSLPILALPVYSPYEDVYYIGDKSKIDSMVSGRQQQVVKLIRQLLLKRFESSIAAFEETCIRIYFRLYTFVRDYKEMGNSRLIERGMNYQADIIAYVEDYINNRMCQTLEEFEDDLPGYVWDAEEHLNPCDFNIRAMLDDTLLDMEVLSGFIKSIMSYDESKDDKIHQLIGILSEDSRVKGKKVIIFSEYRSTARYIHAELTNAGYKGLYEIDGQTGVDRHDVVKRFSPYYNESTSAKTENEIQILIATDVLAEGLNLQDASCLINYDLHWNPVRLMQRIGRIDRRRDAATEKLLVADHPELEHDRIYAYYWNFLPPVELEQLLNLYERVSQKTLRISKAFGIEGKKLLTPDDEYDALKDFNSQYEGKPSGEEEMALAYQKLLAQHPDYPETVALLPRKMYSGKKDSDITGYFFCYELPKKRVDGTWTNGDGWYRWYVLDTRNTRVIEIPYDIWKNIRCTPEEPRVLCTGEDSFSNARKTIENHIKRNYLRAVQAPINVRPRLVTWMEI